MIRDLKPYLKYKEFQAPWLTEIPAHWQTLPGFAVFRENQTKNAGMTEKQVLSLSYGRIITKSAEKLHGLVPESFETYQIVNPGDIIIRGTDLQNDHTSLRVGLVRNRGIITSAYICLQATEQVVQEYGYQLLHALDLTKVFYGLGSGLRQNLSFIDFKRLPLFMPPSDEQAAIVRFLDHTNRRLDRTIQAKRKLISLLNELKQAIIHRAITRGLDPTVPLKSSGIPWLGDIPEHWAVQRVKQTSRILRGKFSHRPRNDPSLYDGPYPFIQTGAVARAKKFITSYTQTLNEKGLAVSKVFPRGTLVMTIAANIGDVAVLNFDACFPDSIVGFVPSKSIDRDYLYFVLLCMKPELLREAPVNTQGNLNVERIGAMGIPLPPIEEQQSIIRYVEENTSAFDAPILRTEREIALLIEYRIRLVADVVAGKLDVREAAQNLPGEADELEITSEPDDAEELEADAMEGA